MIFPVKVPYTISADISKYSGSAFAVHPDPFYIVEKRKELQQWQNDICSSTEDAAAYIHQAAKYIGAPDVDTIESLALTIEEDIAILKNGVVKAICFCFPSGFIPAHIIGLDFFQVHAPVADGDKLRAAGPKVSELISKEGAMFRRFVWGVSSLGRLSQHPGYERPLARGIDELFFRTETQTTVGLTEAVTVFFVKVEMHPLAEIWEDMDKRKQLVESICSMSEAVLTYKHLIHIKSLLLNNQ